MADKRIGGANLPGLTESEERVFQRLVRGESNKEIARRLGCTTKNVEFHVSNILRKAKQPTRIRLLASVAGLT